MHVYNTYTQTIRDDTDHFDIDYIDNVGGFFFLLHHTEHFAHLYDDVQILLVKERQC
jgi:hypothetical protein